MKRFAITIGAILLAGMLAAGAVSAQGAHFEASETGKVTIGKTMTVGGALYGAGDTVTVDGTVDGDIFCAGRELIVTGDVTGDIICAGQTVHISGTVEGDIRVAGQTIIIDGTVEGSVTAFGETIRLGSEAKIGRDFNGSGMALSVHGEVGRDLIFSGSIASIHGVIGRDIHGHYEELAITSDASVGGNAVFEGNDVSIAPGVVAGVTEYVPLSTDYQAAPGSDIAFRLIQAGALVVLSLLVALLLPGALRRMGDVTPGRFGLGALLGLGLLIGMPIVAVIVSLTLVGVSVGIVLMLAWLLMLFLALPFASYYVGRAVLRKTGVANPVAIMAIGVVLVVITTSLPWVGGWIMFLAVIAGFGLGVRALFQGRNVAAVAKE